MQIGEVLGSIVCTIKDDYLKGMGLKIVRLYENGKPVKLVVAGDALWTSGNGDFVYLISSKEAAIAFHKELMAVDLAIMGFADEHRPPYSHIKNYTYNGGTGNGQRSIGYG